MRAELHLPEGHDLKSKRKQVKSLRDQLRSRLGVAVAETAFHDKWQRAELTIATVGRDARTASDRAAEAERLIRSRFADAVTIERATRNSDEMLEG